MTTESVVGVFMGVYFNLLIFKSIKINCLPYWFDRGLGTIKIEEEKPYRLNRYDASLRRFCFCPPSVSPLSLFLSCPFLV